MKRLYQTILLILVIPLWTYAQQPDTTTGFSLEDCIKYALEHTVESENARVDERIAEARVKEAVGAGLPQIDAQVQLTHNEKLQPFFGRYSTVSALGGGGVTEVDPTEPPPPPLFPPDAVVSQANFFQLKDAGDAKLTINQLLFSGSYLVGLKAASTYKELAYKTTEQTEIDLIQNVTKAYYSVLINNERIVLFDNNIARVDSLLRSTTAMNKNGFAEEIDVDRTRVQLNNLKTERLKFLNSQALALILLKFQMNYPMSDPLQVRGNIQSIQIDENLLNQYQTDFDPKNRIEYRRLETQRDLQQLDARNKFASGMPTLSAFANLGYMTQSTSISGLFKTDTHVSSEAAALGFGADKWYHYSLFGVTLNVPIFSGLQRNYRLQQSRLELLKIENNFKKVNQSINMEIQQNSVTYRNTLETLKAQQENMTLASKVARVTKIKYEQGVGSNIEVTDAESSLREAQVNYYNALYDAIVAKVDLDKTYGRIKPEIYSTKTTNQK